MPVNRIRPHPIAQRVRQRSIPLVITALLVVLLGAAPAAQQSGRYYRMKWARMVDQHGFGQPVEAARLLIPADWRFEGGVRWGQPSGCMQNVIQASARALSPDGMSGIEIFTPYTWQWHDDPYNVQTAQQTQNQVLPALRPCDMRPPARAVDFIRQAVIPRYRQGARIVGTEALPQLAQARQAVMQQQLAPYIQAGAIRGARVDAGKVMITYQVNGQAVEEWITGMIEMVAAPAMSASAAMQGGMATVNAYTITATSLIGTRAPAGQLAGQSKMYAAIVGSIRPNIQWAMAVQQVFTNVGNVATEEAGKRSRIWAEASRHTGDLITRQYAANQAVQDRLASAYSQSVRGVEAFVDPSTRERVELTGGYRQAWSNGRGEYILSDDPNFNPATVLREQWVELQRAPN